MIESRFGKIGTVSSLLVLAAVIALAAPAHKRRGFYMFSSGLAIFATYIAIRVKTWEPPAPTSIVGDADRFISDHADYIQRFEIWAQDKPLRRESADAMLEDLWAYRDEILGDRFNELFPVVLAAYGDAYVRQRRGAKWMTIRNQLAVGVPRRPWTYQRLEVALYDWLDAGV